MENAILKATMLRPSNDVAHFEYIHMNTDILPNFKDIQSDKKLNPKARARLIEDCSQN